MSTKHTPLKNVNLEQDWQHELNAQLISGIEREIELLEDLLKRAKGGE